MKFTVDRDVLVGKLAVASQTIGKGAALKTNPTLSGFLFTVAADGKSSVLTTNNQQFTKTTFEVSDVEDEGVFLVEGDRFYKIVSALEEGDVNFDVGTKNVKIASADGEHYNLPNLDAKDFPDINEWIDNASPCGEIEASVLAHSLDFLRPSISTNENQPIYTFAEYDPESQAFKATTGVVLAFYKTKLDTKQPIKIWGSSIPALVGFIKGMDKIALAETTNHVLFRRDDDVFGFTKVTHNFRAAKVKPDDFSEPDRFTVSKAPLEKALFKLGQARDSSKDKYIRFTIAGDGDAAAIVGRVIGHTGAESASKRIQIERVKSGKDIDDSYEIPVTFDDLVATLNSFDADKVDVYVNPGKWLKLVGQAENGDMAIAMVA